MHEALDQPAGDRRGEQGIAAGDDADGVDQLLGRRRFQQEPARPRLLGSAGAWIAYAVDDSRGESSRGMRLTAVVVGVLAAVASAVAYVMTG